MTKLLSALTLTLLLTVNTLANDGTTSTESSSSALATVMDAIVVVAIAIPNLLK